MCVQQINQQVNCTVHIIISMNQSSAWCMMYNLPMSMQCSAYPRWANLRPSRLAATMTRGKCSYTKCSGTEAWCSSPGWPECTTGEQCLKEEVCFAHESPCQGPASQDGGGGRRQGEAARHWQPQHGGGGQGGEGAHSHLLPGESCTMLSMFPIPPCN